MKYKITFMEGFRSWPVVPTPAAATVARYFGQIFQSLGNGASYIRPIVQDGITYQTWSITNPTNWGNGRIAINNPTYYYKTEAVLSDPTKRVYMGFRYLTIGSVPPTAGWIVINLGNVTGSSTISLPAVPATSGTWYFEVVLDRSQKAYTVYRNGVRLMSGLCDGTGGQYIASVVIGSPADTNTWYGKQFGITDVYFAEDNVDKDNQEPHNIHGPIIVDDVRIEDFTGNGWESSDSTMTPVEVLAQPTATGSPNEKTVNSPFDGTPGTIKFKPVEDGDIRGVMAVVYARRGLSSTGKLKMELGNTNFSKKSPAVIAVPPYTENSAVGNYYIPMAYDWEGRPWISDSINDLRLRITSIAEMAKE